jgi:uncharacterized protein (TIGR02265 family)
MLLTATPDQPLQGDVDIEQYIHAVPDGHSIKGLFLASPALILQDRWNEIETKLIAPPRLGRYLPFSDYPLRDYLRVIDLAARRRHPRVPAREAHRLLSRNVFDTFSGSTLGLITNSMVSGPASALSKYQEIYNAMTRGSSAHVTALEAQLVQVDFRGYYSTVEAVFGVVEGIVMAFGAKPTLTVKVAPRGHVSATVHWTGGVG